MIKKILIIFSILVLLSLAALFFYFNNSPTTTLSYKLEEFDITLKIKECNSCYLDWTIDYDVTINYKNNSSQKKFSTETPGLVIAANKSMNKLLLFGTTTNYFVYSKELGFDELNSNEVLNSSHNDFNDKFKEFKPILRVTNQKKIITIDSTKSFETILDKLMKGKY